VLTVAKRLDPLWEAGLSGIGLLVDLLAGIPDPRDPQGVRHGIGTVLSVMVFAVLGVPVTSGRSPIKQRICRRSCWRRPDACNVR